MTFVSGYRMVFNLFKLEQIYNSVICKTMVLSSTIITVIRYKKLYLKLAFIFNISRLCYRKQNDRLWPRNATITDCRPTWHVTVRKGHKVGIVQPITVQYRYLSYDVASGSEITPCNKICKPLVVYRFTGNVITSITTLRTWWQNHNVLTPEMRFQRICHMINRI